MHQHWQPTAALQTLKQKARMLHNIRAFFAERNVLEIDTPSISKTAVTDPQLESFVTHFQNQQYFLHTSPEFHMKRLLAAGSGDIYQLAKVFRNDEKGRHHNPEFTLLEWYRLGFDHFQLMGEIEILLTHIMPKKIQHFQRISYQHAFISQLQIDPLTATVSELKHSAQQHHIETPQGMSNNKDLWLDWLMIEKIAPSFKKNTFTFLYNYPASQASLARLDKNDARIANRFELFFGELELANGFYELTDAQEQKQRFEKDNEIRAQHNQKIMPIDNNLIDALNSGLPNCAGVAIGIDRLLMLLTNTTDIKHVMSFGNEFVRDLK